jgi:hypothetical protein
VVFCLRDGWKILRVMIAGFFPAGEPPPPVPLVQENSL